MLFDKQFARTRALRAFGSLGARELLSRRHSCSDTVEPVNGFDGLYWLKRSIGGESDEFVLWKQCDMMMLSLNNAAARWACRETKANNQDAGSTEQTRSRPLVSASARCGGQL